MRYRVMLVVALLLCAASLLNAHDLFIKLESYFLAPHSSVNVPILNGSFVSSENAIMRMTRGVRYEDAWRRLQRESRRPDWLSFGLGRISKGSAEARENSQPLPQLSLVGRSFPSWPTWSVTVTGSCTTTATTWPTMWMITPI
jgi:hypothetical protein